MGRESEAESEAWVCACAFCGGVDGGGDGEGAWVGEWVVVGDGGEGGCYGSVVFLGGEEAR